MGLDEEMAALASKASVGGGDGKMSKQVKQEMMSSAAVLIDELLDQKMALRPPDGQSAEEVTHTMHERAVRRKILKEFQQACTKCLKCANCNAFSNKIRHDQFNKMFQVALPARNAKVSDVCCFECRVDGCIILACDRLILFLSTLLYHYLIQSNIAERIRIRPACASIHGGEAIYNDEAEEAYPDSEDEMYRNDGSSTDEEDSNDEDADEFHDARDGMIDDEAREDFPANTKGKKKKKSTSSTTVDEEIDPTGGPISRKATVSTTKNIEASKQDNFMHALEVEAQCRLTWNNEPFLCSKFFGCAHAPEHMSATNDDGANVSNGENRPRSTSDAAEAISGGGKGYTLFFLRAVPVPPSRFRPPVIMGNMTVEHSQNFYLSKVLELNARIRSAFATIHELTQEEADLKNTVEGSGSGANSKQLKKIRADKDKGQANMLEIWVDLQTTVNCFMDSTRDPKGTANNAPNGIRQLLEKKEGIFRK